jgi:DNA-binding IclR family transcriptional regulator
VTKFVKKSNHEENVVNVAVPLLAAAKAAIGAMEAVALARDSCEFT